MLHPYPGNHLSVDKKSSTTLSRASWVVENAFGIMASRFRVFHHPLMISLQSAGVIVKAALVLHNFLRKEVGVQYIGRQTSNYEDTSGKLHPGKYRNEWKENRLVALCRSGRSKTRTCNEIRNQFKNFQVVSVMSVPKGCCAGELSKFTVVARDDGRRSVLTITILLPFPHNYTDMLEK